MALTVATNTGALMAQAAASSVNKEMEISMERLSTGKRINAASDDAAGVAIASRLTSEIRVQTSDPQCDGRSGVD
jgi:flagellin